MTLTTTLSTNLRRVLDDHEWMRPDSSERRAIGSCRCGLWMGTPAVGDRHFIVGDRPSYLYWIDHIEAVLAEL